MKNESKSAAVILPAAVHLRLAEFEGEHGLMVRFNEKIKHNKRRTMDREIKLCKGEVGEFVVGARERIICTGCWL